MGKTEVNSISPFIGKKLNRMKVQTTQGPKKIPDDYKGNWIILLCHPGDFNLTCLEKFYAFTTKIEEFKKLKTELIAFTDDKALDKKRCIRWINQQLRKKIHIPVITDCYEEKGSIYELLHASKKFFNVSVIDNEGFIRLIIYCLNSDINVDEIIGTVRTLQTAKGNFSGKIIQYKGEEMNYRLAAAINETGDKEIIADHFGKCTRFNICELDSQNNILNKELIFNPLAGEHGNSCQLPAYVNQYNVRTIIAGGMGEKAVAHFLELGIDVMNAPGLLYDEALDLFIKGKLNDLKICSPKLEH